MPRHFLIIAFGLLSCCLLNLSAQTEEPAQKEAIQPPKVFLDKSPRIVWFQLNRLDNERLLLVERKTDDPKYVPVYTAILTRAGMSRQDREEALAGLNKIKKTDAFTELLVGLEELDADDRQDQRTAAQLAEMLLSEPMKVLAEKEEVFAKATTAENKLLRPLGYAGLIVSGKAMRAGYHAADSPQTTLDCLAATPLIPLGSNRQVMWQPAIDWLDKKEPEAVRKAAIQALAHLPYHPSETFQRIMPFVSDAKFRAPAIKTLLQIPPKKRPTESVAKLAKVLVEYAEATPAALRTTEDFLNAMQLADQLLASLPVESARSYRERLRAVTVRVVQIRTVEEEMRYDTPYFAVEAGRPVQVVLKNEDLMPHNFVITQPGALQETAEAGAVLGPNPGFEGKPYVPKSDKVMHATGMVQVGKLERLTFTAPKEPGEYPYVCTFPRHWMRMYGVMV
ncbi:MAG: azurin, partial [Planctomycetaceae bacterium]|nr:azurin [Planctomycetaceae bacterium]